MKIYLCTFKKMWFDSNVIIKRAFPRKCKQQQSKSVISTKRSPDHNKRMKEENFCLMPNGYSIDINILKRINDLKWKVFSI